MTQSSLKSRILIVDDEFLIADTLALIFKGHGFEAVAAYSGEEAVRVAHSFRPDLLMIDVVMGRMSGVDAASLISSAYPDCRVVFFSGNMRAAGLLTDARREGFPFDVVTKPMHPEELLARLAELGAISTVPLPQ